jgi:hypothetical protein
MKRHSLQLNIFDYFSIVYLLLTFPTNGNSFQIEFLNRGCGITGDATRLRRPDIGDKLV